MTPPAGASPLNDLAARLKAAAANGSSTSPWVTVECQLIGNPFDNSNAGVGLACSITPTDTRYGVGVAGMGLFSEDQQTFYCGGMSWSNPNGTVMSGQIGVPLTIIAASAAQVGMGQTFTVLVSGQVFSPTAGYHSFDITTTVTS